MKLIVALIAAILVIGEASMGSFKACLMQKIGHVKLCRSESGIPECSPACESATEDLASKFDGSCCSEVPKMPQCEQRMKNVGADILSKYHQQCSYTMGDFTAALSDVMPFELHAHAGPVGAVAEEAGVNVGVIAVGAAIAGAVGASVALAVASWSALKQDVLLAN
eukprot:TRINITY_DN49635_c0_g1_i1.p1 TRINITY_DN49635_c0_g1~~TRINITY_DN49635_c0_g1_i1.p1  ORF type:complete len:166 (+),score=20.10 TRINITY_DN49635_c0_g1_i1:83-580(+)